MKLHEIKAPKGANKNRKRVGRGRGSGNGKTAGRGAKGQKSRAGTHGLAGFEGGQMPLARRLPKIGFRHAGKEWTLVNVEDLEAKFADGETVDVAALQAKGLAKKKIGDGIKILGRGDLGKKLTVKAHKVSAGAREKIEKAGGAIEILPERGGKPAAAPEASE